jgi:hypothetical protein
MRCHLTLVRVVNIKRQIIKYASNDVEENEFSYSVGGYVNLCSHYGKQYGSILKN